MQHGTQKRAAGRSVHGCRTGGIHGTERTGPVSSRTNIIRTLVNRKYIRYSGKYIVPTPKGMFTYETIRGKKIADTSLTADWEKQLAGLESGMITGQDFLNRIRTLAKEMTDDIFNTYSTKEE